MGSHVTKLTLAAMVLSAVGCMGAIRETTTPRSSTELLLISLSAERAVKKYDVGALRGKRVFIDQSYFESVDKNYVLDALSDHLAGHGVILAPRGDPVTEKTPDGAEVILEIRNATLGIWDGDFNLGIPGIPVAAQGFPPVELPTIAFFRRLSQQGFTKLQLWLYDAATKKFLGASPDLWGHSFYNQWWIFAIGPFEGSNDIYPEIDFGDFIPGGESDDG